MNTRPDTILFTPHLDQVGPLINALISDHCSLPELAARHHTSTEALSLWMTSPAIRARIEATDSGSCWHTRLIASSHLPKVVAALTKILDAYLQSPRTTTSTRAGSLAVPPPKSCGHPTPNTTTQTSDSPPSGPAPNPNLPLSPSSTSPFPLPLSHFQHDILAHRRTETARKAAAILVRLTNYHPTPAPRAQPASSTPHVPVPSALAAPIASPSSTPPAPLASPQPPHAADAPPAIDAVAHFLNAFSQIPRAHLESLLAEAEAEIEAETKTDLDLDSPPSLNPELDSPSNPHPASPDPSSPTNRTDSPPISPSRSRNPSPEPALATSSSGWS